MHVFLDIDGVLMSQRAYALPENVGLTAAAIGRDQRQAMLAARFDPCAVALVNRLCERTGATIAVLSSWRGSLSKEELIDKLVDGGIERRHFHAVPICPRRMKLNKGHDIGLWFDEAYPPADELNGQEQDEHAERVMAETPYLVLDDDVIPLRGGEQILTSFDEGFSVNDYAAAIWALGGTDPDMGAMTIASDLMAEVVAAHGGSKVAAARWLRDRWEAQAPRRAWAVSDEYVEYVSGSPLVGRSREDAERMRAGHVADLRQALSEMPSPGDVAGMRP